MLKYCRNVRVLRKNVRMFSELVQVVEAGPRSLQNIKDVPAERKVELINKLSQTGLRSIKIPSFVSPKEGGEMLGNKKVFEDITKNSEVEYSVDVPNLKEMKKVAGLGVNEVELFVGASETFHRKNFNSSIQESLSEYREVRKVCKEKKIRTRGVISGVLGCPYEGEIKPKVVAKIVENLFDIGCYEILLSDIIGVCTPSKFIPLLNEIKTVTDGDVWRLSVDFNNINGQALVNIYECLNQGIRIFESSIAGLGGNPFTPGVTGSISTEDLVYLLHGEGMETGVDLDKLIRIGDFITQSIPNVVNNSTIGKVALAREKQHKPSC